jgi:RNA polymerase sigma factor for flagellar operon FliA
MGSSTESALSPYHPAYRKDSHGSGEEAAARIRMTREQQFLSELAVIERVIAWVSARRGLRGADADDFASVVKMRLVENDYEILSKFQGRSSLKTYLTAVINRLYLDFQVQRFGKWRSSAEAKRLGTTALRLECLMFRDGLSFDEACGVLLSDPRVSETRDALDAVCQRLPHRPGRIPKGNGHVPVRIETGPSAVERAERQALAERTFAAIRQAISSLPASDRLFMRLHLESGLTVAQASRSLGLDQKAQYRKREDILRHLRAALEAEGIGSEAARELLANLDWDAAFNFQDVVQGTEQAAPRPSQGYDTATRREGEP